VETAVLQRADVDDSENLPPHQKGCAEKRLDALLAQDRIENVGVVDVLKRNRLDRRGDAPRESQADWNPDSLLDLLL
jgi:hypothetical protein